MVMVAVVLVYKCVVVDVVWLVVVVVACVDLLILLVDVVAVEIGSVVHLLVCCTSIFAVVVVVVVDVFPDCDDFLHLCVGLSCFVGWRFCTEALVVVVDSVLVLDCVGLVV